MSTPLKSAATTPVLRLSRADTEVVLRPSVLGPVIGHPSLRLPVGEQVDATLSGFLRSPTCTCHTPQELTFEAKICLYIKFGIYMTKFGVSLTCLGFFETET